MLSRRFCARKRIRLTTYSGFPVSGERSTGFCVATPPAGVQIAHAHHHAADATSGRVANPNSSAPSRAAIAMSRPVMTFRRFPRARARATVCNERLMRFGQAELPREAGMLKAGARACAGPAVVAGNQDDVRAALGNACGDGPNAGFRNELDVDPARPDWRFSNRKSAAQDPQWNRYRGAAAERSVLHRPWNGASWRSRDRPFAGKVPAFAGLRALRHFDLDFLCGRKVRPGHAAEPTGRDLLDCGICGR